MQRRPPGARRVPDVSPAGAGPHKARSRDRTRWPSRRPLRLPGPRLLLKALKPRSAQAAAITFSSELAFDFDQSDGIGTGLWDFVGIAIHALGHAIGFFSCVDLLDRDSGGPGQGTSSDAFFSESASTLDFNRRSQAGKTAGGDMDWTVGNAAKDFAIDGDCTALVSDAWSTAT